MVRAGMALAFTRNSADYVQDEAAAKARTRKPARPEGLHPAPWDWPSGKAALTVAWGST